MSTMNYEENETEIVLIPCPSPDAWQRYTVGDLDEADFRSFDFHLNRCVACNALLEKLEDAVLEGLAQRGGGGLRGAAGASNDESQIVANVVQAAKAGRLQWDHIHHEGTYASATLSGSSQPAGGQITLSVVGPYRLLRPLAAGGMGRVYLAEHVKLRRQFALKLVPQSMAPSGASDRFEREIQAIGKLSHPAIVQATDAGADAGYLYLAMEYVDGWDLSQLLRSSRKMQTHEICEIGHRLALALSNAHHSGMVHRDIKPSNVMLDKLGNLKLLDFGLVLLDRWDSPLGELTTVGQFLGTLDYMAPEQAEKSAAVDHRSDLYSLGATLFRLFTGELPLPMLPHQSPLEKLRVLRDHAPVGLKTLRKDLPVELCQLIDGMLATEPSKRPASASAIAERLVPFAKDADLRRLADDLGASTFESNRGVSPLACPPLPSLAAQAGMGNRWGRRGLWALAAALPFALFYGVHLVLEDSSGNLVIESELDDIDLKIVRTDGVALKEIQIDQGNSITKLRTGNYEIQVPAETATVTPKVITLSKGETVIARIERQPPSEERKASGAAEPGQGASGQGDSKLLALIPDDKRSAVIQGLPLLTYLQRIRDELELSSWNSNVQIVQRGIPMTEELEAFIFDQYMAKNAAWKRPAMDAIGLLPPGRVDDWIAEEFGQLDAQNLANKTKTIVERVWSSRDAMVSLYPKTIDAIEQNVVHLHAQNQVVDLSLIDPVKRFPGVFAVQGTWLLEWAPTLTVELAFSRSIPGGPLAIVDNDVELYTSIRERGATVVKNAAERKAWDVFFDLLERLDVPVNSQGRMGTHVPEVLGLFVDHWTSGDPSVHQAVKRREGISGFRYVSSSAWVLPPSQSMGGMGGMGGMLEATWMPASTRFLQLLERRLPNEQLNERLSVLLDKLRKEDSAGGIEISLEDYAAEWGLALQWASEGELGKTLSLVSHLQEGPVPDSTASAIHRKFTIRFLEGYLLGDGFNPGYPSVVARELAAVRKAIKEENWEEASKRLSKDMLEEVRGTKAFRNTYVEQSTIIEAILTRTNETRKKLNWTEFVGTYTLLSNGNENLLSSGVDGPILTKPVQAKVTFLWEDHRWKVDKFTPNPDDEPSPRER